jgi:hypothetical protein
MRAFLAILSPDYNPLVALLKSKHFQKHSVAREALALSVENLKTPPIGKPIHPHLQATPLQRSILSNYDDVLVLYHLANLPNGSWIIPPKRLGIVL